MDFVNFVTLFLKLWCVTITTVPVKKLVPLVQMLILKRESRNDSKMKCAEITYNKRVTKLLKCKSLSGGVFIKPMHQSEATSKKTFPTNDL